MLFEQFALSIESPPNLHRHAPCYDNNQRLDMVDEKLQEKRKDRKRKTMVTDTSIVSIRAAKSDPAFDSPHIAERYYLFRPRRSGLSLTWRIRSSGREDNQPDRPLLWWGHS